MSLLANIFFCLSSSLSRVNDARCRVVNAVKTAANKASLIIAGVALNRRPPSLLPPPTRTTPVFIPASPAFPGTYKVPWTFWVLASLMAMVTAFAVAAALAKLGIIKAARNIARNVAQRYVRRVKSVSFLALVAFPLYVAGDTARLYGLHDGDNVLALHLRLSKRRNGNRRIHLSLWTPSTPLVHAVLKAYSRIFATLGGWIVTLLRFTGYGPDCFFQVMIQVRTGRFWIFRSRSLHVLVTPALGPLLPVAPFARRAPLLLEAPAEAAQALPSFDWDVTSPIVQRPFPGPAALKAIRSLRPSRAPFWGAHLWKVVSTVGIRTTIQPQALEYLGDLGQGGFGTVIQAKSGRSRNVLAIKRLDKFKFWRVGPAQEDGEESSSAKSSSSTSGSTSSSNSSSGSSNNSTAYLTGSEGAASTAAPSSSEGPPRSGEPLEVPPPAPLLYKELFSRHVWNALVSEVEVHRLMRNHPAFPVLHGVFHDREHFYMAMTFGGRSFTSVQVATRQRGLRLGAQLVLAVHALHKRGVVHSDIKHGNLLLSHNNRITLIDFGLSHIFDMASPTLEEWPAWNALKEAGTDSFPMLWADEPNPHVCLAMGGTPGYMSPLVRWQEEVSYGADLWAVGVILHHWLTGSYPTIRFGSVWVQDPALNQSEVEVSFFDRIFSYERGQRFEDWAELKAHPLWNAISFAEIEEAWLAGYNP